jgi:glycosyltransferase involved in cell wall biosynthesis
MPPLSRLPSITAMFPAYNDAGTIPSMVIMVMKALADLTDDFEVVVVNDGSQDYTAEVLAELCGLYPRLRVITHPHNSGYGAALRTGFSHAAKEWIFYTDGDAQYDPHELRLLAEALSRTGADIANGYKIARSDPLHRLIIGGLYHHFVRIVFRLPLRDTDCDFRLFRRSVFDRVQLESDSGTIALEMVKKFHDAGFRFVEVPVHHYHRAYGGSQFFNFRRLFRTAVQLSQLWWKLVVRRDHLRAARPADSEAAVPLPTEPRL